MGTDAGETPRARAHHVTDPLIEVDLAIQLEAVRASDSYRAADHAAKTIAKQPVALTRGCLLTVPPGVAHRVRGMNQSGFLLTIGEAHDLS